MIRRSKNLISSSGAPRHPTTNAGAQMSQTIRYHTISLVLEIHSVCICIWNFAQFPREFSPLLALWAVGGIEFGGRGVQTLVGPGEGGTFGELIYGVFRSFRKTVKSNFFLAKLGTKYPEGWLSHDHQFPNTVWSVCNSFQKNLQALVCANTGTYPSPASFPFAPLQSNNL